MTQQAPTGVHQEGVGYGGLDIDWAFIATLEGMRLDGYVPAAKTTKSGVTIAAGFDMGGRNRSSLENLGLAPSLVTKLVPYCGMTGTSAEAYVKRHPLWITQAEAESIDRAIHAAVIDQLVERYDKDSQVPFTDLPGEAQTVIASVEFQYGSAKTGTPNFWRLVTAQRWEETVHALRHFNDSYPTRRRKEAAYLEKIVPPKPAPKATSRH
ncbi:MAG: pesticin C-terminus-like muramidase [Minicystis sp.]